RSSRRGAEGLNPAGANMRRHAERSRAAASSAPDSLYRRVPTGQPRLLHRLPPQRRGNRPLARDERSRTPPRDGRAAARSPAMMDTLVQALRPLSAPPEGPAWNHAEVNEWLGDQARLPAAVLLGIREGVQPRLVFTVRDARLPAHAGQVAFPGGRSEPRDADAVDTALRESEEEIGLSRALVKPLGFLDRFETISGYSVTPVVASIAAEARLYPSPDEVAEVFEVPLTFLFDPANLRRYTMEFRGQQRPMVEFVHAGHRIWGATAAMLCNLLERMDRT